MTLIAVPDGIENGDVAAFGCEALFLDEKQRWSHERLFPGGTSKVLN